MGLAEKLFEHGEIFLGGGTNSKLGSNVPSHLGPKKRRYKEGNYVWSDRFSFGDFRTKLLDAFILKQHYF